MRRLPQTGVLDVEIGGREHFIRLSSAVDEREAENKSSVSGHLAISCVFKVVVQHPGMEAWQSYLWR